MRVLSARYSSTLFVLYTLYSKFSFVAWILHNSTGNGKVNVFKRENNDPIAIDVVSAPTDDFHKSTLNARKHPTRTQPSSSSSSVQNLIKRSEMESDEEKDDDIIKQRRKKSNKSRRPTRTRKLSFEPEMVIDYKPQFRPVRK